MVEKQADKPKEPKPEARQTPRPVGRPRKVFTEEQLARIDELAEAQCKDTTIAEALEIDPDTFKRHFAERTRQKRALGKATVMQKQYKGCMQPGAVTERIWWGKQHLEQKDRQDISSDDGALIVPGIVFIGERPKPREEGAGVS